MNHIHVDVMQSPRITKDAFDRISKYVNYNFGINLTEGKRNLVENRLFKRLRLLRMDSYAQYIDHIFHPNGKEELELLCDFLSTNKTYFYREPAHFEFLRTVINEAGSNRYWKIWSAACSAGDEAYTLGCLFEENPRPLQYSILGTDISQQMIKEALVASYHQSRIAGLPVQLRKNYFEKEVDEKDQVTYRAGQQVRKNIRFQVLNLIKDIPALNERFDVIFCRNVLIYFKEEVKIHVVEELISKLNPGGYLFLAHCEGMICRHMGLKQIRPAVFQKEK